ncbi:MAG: glycosyltransferase family 4 protein [Bacteroidota bacterium]
MRIVLINPCFSEGMGYIENCLPKALASLGHEVFLLTSTGQVYFNHPFYKATYKEFLGESVVEPVEKQIDGYVLKRLSFRLIAGKVLLKGLIKTIRQVDPDIVQTFDPFSLINIQVILAKPFMHYKIFTGNHIMQSVFPLALSPGNKLILKRFLFYVTRTLPAKFFNVFIEKSFPITVDAWTISEKYYSIPVSKMRIIPLGIDTQLFQPPWTEQLLKKKEDKRSEFGINNDEILCIYTGRFSEGKNPLCLAHAVALLRSKGEKYKGLFVGHGVQLEKIRELDGCITLPFLKFSDLADIYLMGDIGVWPREESTSMLDASASGLPLIISNKVQATERINDIGYTYIENDVTSMSTILLKLRSQEIRKILGRKGVERMVSHYSWIRMAELRIEEYHISDRKNLTNQ